MTGIEISRVTHDLLSRLDSALRLLAADLGDVYATDQGTLAAAVCGPDAVCLALLAIHDDAPVGAVLAAPIFSTTRGGAGLFVSDLWVAPDLRGNSLSRRLLAATLAEGTRRGTGHFLKLSVYSDNPRASAVYDRLGFATQEHETNLILTGAQLSALKETT